MTFRVVVRGLLLLFVVTSLAVTIARETGIGGTADDRSRGSGDDRAAISGERDGVIAYYFHGTRRCKTCLAIEAASRETLENEFPEELMSGTLDFREVNTDEPENAHFVRDFDLVGSSLVLVETRNGRVVRHRVLDEVWNLYGDREAMMAYVRDETRRFLEIAR